MHGPSPADSGPTTSGPLGGSLAVLPPPGWTELTDSLPSTGTSTVFEDTAASNLQRVFYLVVDVTP